MHLKKLLSILIFPTEKHTNLGAKIIASGDAKETLSQVEKNPTSQRTIKEAECKLVEERKHQLEEELKRL